MKKDPITIAPETPSLEALQMMRELDIGCLPIVRDGQLIGIITAHDFLTVSSKLLEEKLIDLAIQPNQKKDPGGKSNEYGIKAA